MRKIKGLLCLIALVIIVTGCNTSNKKESSTREQVKDESIINTIKNHVIGLEYLDTTLKGFEKGKIEASEYNDNDKISYGIKFRIAQGGLEALTKEQVAEAAKLGLTSVNEYVSVSDIEKNINLLFGPSAIKYDSIDGCPIYKYSSTSKLYYVSNNCTDNNTINIVSYLDEITKKDNEYYATVYAGIIDTKDKKVYGDFNKNKLVQQLSGTDSFEITQENKKDFTEYTYTFEKNSDGNYIFKTLEKTK